MNIQALFPPDFKKAKPIHLAHARSIKLNGATAYFVTDDFDEGPMFVVTDCMPRKLKMGSIMLL